MKLLIILTITLAVNISLYFKGSQLKDNLSASSTISTIEDKGFIILNKGLSYITHAKDEIIDHINNYGQYILVTLLGHKSQINPSLPQKLQIGDNSGDSDFHKSDKSHSCFL